MNAEVRLNLSQFKVGVASEDVKFSVAAGAFYDCIIPEQVESLWGPIPLQHLPPGVDNKCRAVTHGYVYNSLILESTITSLYPLNHHTIKLSYFTLKHNER